MFSMDKLLIKEYYYGAQSYHTVEDDVIDRLNSRFTIFLLICGIFIVTSNMYIGKPINCWTPAEFKGTHDGYTNSICWLKGSYYLPTDDITIPDRSKPRTYYVSYYQWTPFILLGMALLFLLPRFVWRAFLRQSGLSIKSIVKAIKDQPDADKGIEQARRMLESYLDQTDNLQGTRCCGRQWRGFYGGYTLIYFLSKILYVINSLGQFFLLNLFLSFNFTGFGVEVLRRTLNGEDWFESPRFPRVTMCDFMVRRLGSNQHWYAIQCNLPINMYNEKIFLCIWFWLIILTILNIVSIITWIVSLARTRRAALAKHYLRISYASSTPEKGEGESTESPTDRILISTQDATRFVNYLKIDGYLLFEIIARNTDEVIAGKILGHLYRRFRRPVYS